MHFQPPSAHNMPRRSVPVSVRFFPRFFVYEETHWALNIIDVTHYAHRAAA